MLEKGTKPILSVTDFPWVKDPVNMQTQEEYAYMCGMHIARLRVQLDDDDIPMIYNMGAGRAEPLPVPDIEALKQQKPDVGPFGVFVAIEPDDLNLYRQILPEHFSMPEKPVLSLVNLDYNQPNPIVRYKEGMVFLKGVGKDGEEAWWVHCMPVETWLMLVMGHDWGFRKDLFDMTITPEKTTVMQKNGELYMSLELTPDPWPDDADGIVPQEQVGGTNNMAVIYPAKPDTVLRFGWTGKGYALDEDKKMVKITVNRDLEWAGLVPEGTTAPGRYMRYTVGGGESYIKKVR